MLNVTAFYLLVESVVPPVGGRMSEYYAPHWQRSKNVSPRSHQVLPVKVLFTYGALYVLPLLLIYPGVLCRGIIDQIEPEHNPDKTAPSGDVEHGLPSKIIRNVTSKGKNAKCAYTCTGYIDTIKPADKGKGLQ